MSAYVVSHRHINVLVTWAAKHKVPGFKGKNRRVVAQRLLDANVASVNFRYHETGGYDPIKFKPDNYGDEHPPVHIIALADCFDYQACEVNNYEQTWASRAMGRIRGTAVQLLPAEERTFKTTSDIRGWREAPWGLHEKGAA